MEEKITAWLARDENGELHIYTTRPLRSVDNGQQMMTGLI